MNTKYISSGRGYDSGVHPGIKKISFSGEVGMFFNEDRFPDMEELEIRTGDSVLHIKASSLKKLDCSHTSKGNIALLFMYCPSLIEFDCSRNQIKGLNFNSSTLRILKCQSNWMEKINLNCPKLVDLDCSYNNLQEVKMVSPCLETANFYSNGLRKIDMDCPRLRSIELGQNDNLYLAEIKLSSGITPIRR